MTKLPRLKPEPIPVINPIPEYAASGPLANAYARTKHGLGVPWMGVVAMAFAQYPRFYEALWCGMEPIVGSDTFGRACEDLRTCAENHATALSPPSILPRLAQLGYNTREIDDIRTCNEVFSTGNMPYLLMASLARLLLEGHEWKTLSDPGISQRSASSMAKPTLIEPHHADPTIAELYADIRATLGLPIVNTDYRAFARWPSYFVSAWQDVREAVSSDTYEHQVTCIHHKAIRIAQGLPNLTRLQADHLRKAAEEDASLDEVLAVVRLFQWLLPGLALNVAFLRAQLLQD